MGSKVKPMKILAISEFPLLARRDPKIDICLLNLPFMGHTLRQRCSFYSSGKKRETRISRLLFIGYCLLAFSGFSHPVKTLTELIPSEMLVDTV